MAGNYNYQLLTGIVKVIRPKDKPVLGIADGKGMFMWLGTDKIITSHPQQFENWQTTIFAIDPNWRIQWKPEQKWDEFKASYPMNTKPIPQPIPQMFLMTSQPTTVPVQQPQQPNPLNTLQTQQQYITPISDSAQTPMVGMDVYVEIIAKELTAIRKLLELYIKPPALIRADILQKTEQEIVEEFGSDPDENLPNTNKDDLPKIF